MSDTASLFDFSSYITERTRNFTGREWVFQAIEAWLADAQGPRFFLLTGNPGSGKSSIAARLAQFSQGSISSPDGYHLLAPNVLSALHFCSARDRRWINPTVFAESLALQLGARYQAFAKALAAKREGRPINIEVTQSATNITGGQMIGVAIHKLVLSAPSAEDAFTHVVREPLEVLLGQEPDQQVIVMVDALDEALTYSGDMNIVSLLAQVEFLPPSARFILTSRKVEQIERAFRKAARFFLSSQKFKAQNQEDIEHFVEGQLLSDEKLATKVNPLLPEKVENLRAEITKKATGNFLYVRFLLDAIAGGQRPLTELEGLPEGLDGLYFDSLERVIKLGKRSWHNEYAPLMGVLSVVQESVTQTQLAALTEQSESDIWEYLGDVQQFLEQGVVSVKEGEKRYRLYHQSVVDFLNQQWLVSDHEELRNPYYCSMKEWHRKVANRCEQGEMMRIWEEERDDLVEQRRREYARKYHITHLYLAQAWQRLFEVLDAVPYGKAKLRNDPSTRSYADDLDLGRKAAAWENWTFDEGFSLLPHLWRYTLLRCSLASRADHYPEAAFRVLMLLGREQEALGLAELLTDRAKKVQVLITMAKVQEQWQKGGGSRKQGERFIDLLMRAYEVACTIEDSDDRAKALGELGAALAQAQEREQAQAAWAEAKRVISTIEDSDDRAKALGELGAALAQALAQAQEWAEAKRVISTIEDSDDRAKALGELGAALAQVQEWAEAKRVISSIKKDSYYRAKALSRLGAALAQAQEREQAQAAWAEAEQVISSIDYIDRHAKALSELGAALAQAQEWAEAERVISSIKKDRSLRASALSELGAALAQAQEREQAQAVWAEAEQVISTIKKDRSLRAKALGELGAALAQAQEREQAQAVWTEAEQVISTIETRKIRADALSRLGAALAQAQEWAEAKRVISTIPNSDDRAKALSRLGAVLAQAQEWAEAKRVISTIESGDRRASALSRLGAVLAQAQEREQAQAAWAEAERVISTITNSYYRASALSELGAALAQAQEREQAQAMWAEAKRVISTIKESDTRAFALRELGAALAQAQEREQAQAVWAEAERVISTNESGDRRASALSELGAALAQAQEWAEAKRVISTIKKDSYYRAKALGELGAALAQAQEREQAQAAWAEAEQVISTIEDREIRADALSRLGAALVQAQEWAEAKRVIGIIKDEDRDSRVETLSRLGAVLAQAQEWAEAERVISTIESGDRRASALRELGAALMNANEHLQLLRLVQRSWQEADTREYAVAILSLVNDLMPLKPEIGIALSKSFSWVDDFLKG